MAEAVVFGWGLYNDDPLQALNIAFPHRPGSGGPGSFQSRIEKQLIKLGWKVVYLNEDSAKPDVVLVIGGTRKILTLLRLKRQGVPIVHRLDGILWMHKKRWPGLRHFVSAQARNLIIEIIHDHIADVAIYQSEFVREWWEKRDRTGCRSALVIHNGTDLDEFSPLDPPWSSEERGDHRIGLLCVEGSIDYSPYAIEVLNSLADILQRDGLSIRLYGGFSMPGNVVALSDRIDYRGPVARHEVYKVYTDSIFLSLDVNAACPNTVIEAMSCGLPVVGFKTGALSELVPRNCGTVVDFGGDPWALDSPEVEPLYEAILDIREKYSFYSRNARSYAVAHYDIRDITAQYVHIIMNAIADRNDSG